jgi:transposase
LHRYLVDHPDLQQVFLDSTVVRANACAAGAKGSCAKNEALGRSRGGFSTKIHAITDALGNPLDFLLTGGEASDIGQAERLIQAVPQQASLAVADKGYDSDGFVQRLQELMIEPVIPPRSNRKVKRLYDRHVYKERHLIECFFGKIKHYRRIFSRFEKTARHFMGFLRLVAALIWMR